MFISSAPSATEHSREGKCVILYCRPGLWSALEFDVIFVNGFKVNTYCIKKHMYIHTDIYNMT